jgi:hypothetical protein
MTASPDHVHADAGVIAMHPPEEPNRASAALLLGEQLFLDAK